MKNRKTKAGGAALLALSILCLFPMFAFAEDNGPYRILAYGPDPWLTDSSRATVEIRVEDLVGAGWKQITAVTTCNSSSYDLTESINQHGRAIIEISDNTDIVVTVTAPDEKRYIDRRRALLFDREGPRMEYRWSEDVLNIQVSDTLSGVESILLEGLPIEGSPSSPIKVSLTDIPGHLEATTFKLTAADQAGNTVAWDIPNPVFASEISENAPADRDVGDGKTVTDSTPAPKNPATGSADRQTDEESDSLESADAEAADSSEDLSEADSPATGNKTSMERLPPEDGEQEAEETVPPMNTDGSGTVIDNATVGPQQREFFTFQTPLGHVFYLVVDRNKENDNVFFLNAVTEQDLLTLAEDESWTENYEADSAAIPEPVESTESSAESGDPSTEVSTPGEAEQEAAPKSPSGVNSTVILFVGVGLLLAVGVYIKIIRPKKALDNADDLEDIEYLDDENDDDDDYNFNDSMEDSE